MSKLACWAGALLATAIVPAAAAKEGTEISGSQSAEEFNAFLNEDTKLWTRLVKDSGIKAE